MSKFFKSMFLLLSAGLFAATSWAAEVTDPYTFTNANTVPTLSPEGGWTYGSILPGLKNAAGENILAATANIGSGDSWTVTFNAPTEGGKGVIGLVLGVVMHNNDGNYGDHGGKKLWVKFTVSANGDSIVTTSDLMIQGTGTSEEQCITISFPNTIDVSGELSVKIDKVDNADNVNGAFVSLKSFGVISTLPDPAWTWDGTGGTATGDSLPSGATVYTVNDYTTTVENVPAKNFTFSFWTKRAGFSWQDVAGFANATGAIGLERGRSNALWFYGTALGQGPDGTDVGFELSNDTLQMVTLVVNNGVITTYVNGSQVAYKCEKNKAAVSGNPTTLTVASWSDLTSESAMMTRFGLGCRPTSSASERKADATIADARVYASALSADEVRLAYLESLVPKVKTYETEISGNVELSEINFVDTVTENDFVSLTATADATVVVDCEFVASKLTLKGSGKITLIGGGVLTVSQASIEANVDVANMNASLGLVTIAREKTLTVDRNVRWTSIDVQGTLARTATDQTVISLNIAEGREGTDNAGPATSSDDEIVGLEPVPGSAWVDLNGGHNVTTTTPSALYWKGMEAKTFNRYSVEFGSHNTYTLNSKDQAVDGILYAYLDDGDYNNDHAFINVRDIPFTKYSVIVYCATDQASRKFSPVTVNNKLYTVDENGATIEIEDATKVFGACQLKYATYATQSTGNAIKVDNLRGDLTIQGGANANGARGGIAAIQIVNTGNLTFAEVESAETELSVSEVVADLPDYVKTVYLTLPDGATLTMDALPTVALKIISTGSVTINVTDLSISQAQLNAMLNTDDVAGGVTNAYIETIGYEVGDATYSLAYSGPTNGWSAKDANEHLTNWYTGTRTNGVETYWIPYTGNTPAIPNGGNLDATLLINGDLIGDKITADAEGYKEVNAPDLEGWTLNIAVVNGVHVKIPSLKKLANGCVIRVDNSSKITVTNKVEGNNDTNNAYYIDAENGLVFETIPMPGGTAYLGLKGSITTQTFADAQTIGGVTLDLGDSTLTGREVVTRTLYTYTSGTNANFTVAGGAVTTNVAGVPATELSTALRKVGDYKFVETDTSYEVQYVAYAATDKIGDASTWTAKEGTAWATLANWTFGVPEDGADATIEITGNTTITIPTKGVTVGVLTVQGEGTLTIDGGMITAAKILANANIAATEDTLALAPMDIADGKTVTYETETIVNDPNAFKDTSHTLLLQSLTGNGTFKKTGVGTIATYFGRDAEPTIEVSGGAIYLCGAGTTGWVNHEKQYTIIAEANTEIRFAEWLASFTNSLSSYTLKGGAQLTLANGANVAGTITIAEAGETPAKICGSSFEAATITADITGSGKVEFAKEGGFNANSPCDQATTYSGTISGNLQVIISDAQPITFSGTNTYTGGTDIATGAQLTITNAGALGSGGITGAGTGTLICDRVLPTNKNGLTTGGWTGTVKLVNVSGGEQGTPLWGPDLSEYSNATSTIEFGAGNSGWLYQGRSCDAKITVSGSMTFDNGYSNDGGYTFNGPLEGTGTIATSGGVTDVLQFLGETKDFAGTVTVDGGHCIAFGEQADTGTAHEGKLIVAAGKTANIAADKTWTAVNDIEVAGTIGGEGSIGEADGTNGSLTLKPGATIDTTKGRLTANGAVTFDETLNIVLPENGLPTAETPVTILNTTFGAEDLGDVNVTLTINGNAAPDYILRKTANAVELHYAPWTTVTEVPAEGDVDSWSEVLADMEAKRQRFDTSEGKTPSLIINFGDGTTPGIFTFDLEDATALSLTKVTVQGTNGGTITKTGAGAVTATATEVNTNVTFGNGALPQGAIAIAEGKTLTLSEGKNEAYAGTITVANGATLHLPYGAGLTHAASSIVLEEGATIRARNGGGNSSTIASAITLNGAATIQGSIYGDNTNFSGAITGTGSLTIRKDPGASNPITFTGANAYTGGTVIATEAKLTVTNAGALGTGNVVNNGALTFAFPAEGEGSSCEYVDVFSGTGDYTLASGSLTWKFGSNVAVNALTVSGGKMTIVPTKEGTSLNVKDAITIANGMLVIAPTVTNNINGVALKTDASVTIRDGGALAFSGQTAYLFLQEGEPMGSSAITVEQGGTIYAGVNSIAYPMTLADGAILDLYGYGEDKSDTGKPLKIGGQLTLPSGVVTVKTPLSLYQFLFYDGDAEDAIPDWMSRFKFTNDEEEEYTLVENTLVEDTYYLYETFVSNEYAYGFASVQSGSDEVQISSAAATDIASLVLGYTRGNSVHSVTNPNVAECFEGFAIDFGDNFNWDDALENENWQNLMSGQSVTLSCDFGISDITVAKKTVDETWIAVAVKVTNGGGYSVENTEFDVRPAALRSGTKIHLSKNGGDSYDEENALTPLTAVELDDADLVNGEGVYWYWAETLPAITSGTTSTTVKYKVKAVKPAQP